MKSRDHSCHKAHAQSHDQGDQQVEGYGVQSRAAQTVLQQKDQHGKGRRRQTVPQAAAEEDGKAAAHQHAAPKPLGKGLFSRRHNVDLPAKLIQWQRLDTALPAHGVELFHPVKIRLPGGTNTPRLGHGPLSRELHGDTDDGRDHQYLHPLRSVCPPDPLQSILHPADLRTGVQQQISHIQHAIQQTALLFPR